MIHTHLRGSHLGEVDRKNTMTSQCMIRIQLWPKLTLQGVIIYLFFYLYANIQRNVTLYGQRIHLIPKWPEFLLFTCKLALVASFKVKYCFEFRV